MNQKISTVRYGEENYPKLLKEIPGAPKTLYYFGKLPPVQHIAIAIVGTRKATRDGIALTRQIAREISSLGITVISGLALGIDAAAHEGALFGGGVTHAVLANGLDSIYPRQHESLAQKIIAGGGSIISEYPEGSPALPHQFLERNRIVSGLCVATVVIEAPERSGALVTARNAIEQGREVFVIPGAVGNRNYRGSHFLIREGARLVTCAKEILEDLGIETREEKLELNGEQKTIFEVLKENNKALDIDSIVELTTLEPHIIQSALAYLEIEGYIEKHGVQWKII